MTAAKLHRGFGWRIPGACVVLAALMLAAGHWTARFGFRTRWLSLQQGCLTAIWVDPLEKEDLWPRYFGGVFANANYRIRWLPGLERHLSLRYLYLPLWMPIPALLAVRGLLYWRDRRRARRGCCPTCAYDLTGNTTGVCPECGAPQPARRSTLDP